MKATCVFFTLLDFLLEKIVIKWSQAKNGNDQEVIERKGKISTSSRLLMIPIKIATATKQLKPSIGRDGNFQTLDRDYTIHQKYLRKRIAMKVP